MFTLDKEPYSRMKMVDLIDETDTMKWAILDYHNQKFVLDNIVDSKIFTREGHAEFLNKYPTLKRKQYIVYIDNRDLGKISFLPDKNNVYSGIGYYLFHENDMHKHLGLLMVSFAYHFLFDELNAEKVVYSALKNNESSIGLSKRLGCRIVQDDEKIVYLECTRGDFYKCASNIDEYLKNVFKE